MTVDDLVKAIKSGAVLTVDSGLSWTLHSANLDEVQRPKFEDPDDFDEEAKWWQSFFLCDDQDELNNLKLIEALAIVARLRIRRV